MTNVGQIPTCFDLMLFKYIYSKMLLEIEKLQVFILVHNQMAQIPFLQINK